MRIYAQSSITLTCINEPFSVSLAPNTCVIRADFDGSNPRLDDARTVVTLYCGDTMLPIDPKKVTVTPSHEKIRYRTVAEDDFHVTVELTDLPYNLPEGHVEIAISPAEELTVTARFNFSVMRESTMLDWIQDWESNKTTIGSTYVITPKIFVGKRLTGDHGTLWEEDGLTGVYIGPAPNDACGVFGYKGGREIFHLDEKGGTIGGWDIEENEIYSRDGLLRIVSDGHIRALDTDANTVWEINSDGTATFARGNVAFMADGSATYKGRITAESGSIGGFDIEGSTLKSIQIGMDSKARYFAIANITDLPTDGGNHLTWVPLYGGVAMYYTSPLDYGFISYKGTKPTFSAGSSNMIASWQFDDNAMWLGTKNNNAGEYTADKDSITLGTNGLRGYSWFINKNGTASFVRGYVQFGETEGKLAGWNFDGSALYTGTRNDTAGEFTPEAGGITLAPSGVRGAAWRLESDGSGSLANGNISWDTEGTVSFSSSVTLMWTGGIDEAKQAAQDAADKAGAAQDAADSAQSSANQANSRYTSLMGTYLTYIGPTGIYSGTVCADNITSGTISTATIKQSAGKWSLNSNGSGSLANGNISWDTAGNLTFSSGVTLTWANISDADTKASSIAATAVTNKIGSKLTYISSTGIYTGILAADQVNALTCTFTKGTIGGWNIGSNYITNNDIYLGSNGDIYCSYGGTEYWRINNAGKASFGKGTSVFNSNGSGSLANGNISWDTAGNVTLSDKCSISFDATEAVKGVVGNKLTNITSEGIYTGSLSASQVNALTCTFSKGTIGGWSVGSSQLSTTGVGYASLEVNIRSNYFLRINNSNASGLLAVRADNSIGIAVEVNTSATTTVCQGLNISCLNVGKGRCIEAIGNSRFEARVGEQIQLLGVTLRTHFISSSSDSIKANDDIVIFTSGSSGSYSLPSPSSCTGKILFVKNKDGGATAITGKCINCNSGEPHSSSSWVGSGASLIYVCDGSSWILYFCG
jgi:hypothetical protein